MSVDWAFRMNGYLPESQDGRPLPRPCEYQRERDPAGRSNQRAESDGIVQEKALPGLDGEVGYLLPIPWERVHASV